jgi:autotransporter-associated beta strand protein
MNRLVKSTLIMIAASLLSVSPIFGAAVWYGGQMDHETDFNWAANWSGDPASETYFSISWTEPTATLNGPSAWTPFDFYIGEIGDGQLNMNPGSSLSVGYFAVGNSGGFGTLNMDGASLTTTSYSAIFGFGAAGSSWTNAGFLNMSNNSTLSAATAVLFGLQPSSDGHSCTATISDSSVLANGSYSVGGVDVGVLVGNGANVTASGASSLAAVAGTVMIRDNSVLTIEGTSTLSSAASIGVHVNSILNVNTTGVIAGDPDGYAVRAPELLAVGFNTENTSGVVNIAAGKVLGATTWLGCFNGSSGAVNISGSGTLVTQAIAIGSIAENTNGTGYVSLNGGTFKPTYEIDTVYVGVYGDGVVDIAAGVMDCTTNNAGGGQVGDAMWIGGANGVSGILNVRGTGTVANDKNVIRMRSKGIINVGVQGAPGGVLQTAGILAAGGLDASQCVVNLHGGKLVATADADGVTIPEGGTSPNPVFIGHAATDVAHVYVYAEGAKIDTNGHQVVIDAPLEAPATGGVYSSAPGTPNAIHMIFNGNGYGYVSAPYVKILDGDGTGPGAGATAIAVMSTINPGEIDHIEITNPGVGYVNPTFTLVGGLGANGYVGTINTGEITTGANASGGLTKMGAGELTLTSDPSYLGDTSVSEGVLTLPNLNTPSAAVTVYDGGTLNAGSLVADSLTIGGTVPGPVVIVPEPSILVLLILAIPVLAGLRWKRKR